VLAEKLGVFIAKTQFSDLSSCVIDAAKKRLLDLIGVGIAGYSLGLYRPLLKVLILGSGESTIWGEGIMTSSNGAAMLNSFMAHSTYLEDGSRFTGGHPSSTVIPAILSLGEKIDASGKQLILSLVVGYEIFIRIGQEIYPFVVNRGFQPTSVLASLGAAGGCAKLLNLDSESCSNALAIAANLGSGLKAALKEPSSQPLQVGRSCEGGLLAALLAQHGIKGYSKILEAYLEAHGGSVNSSKILTNLGSKYYIEDTYIKMHAGCRGNHAPVDVIQKIVLEHKVKPEQVKKINICVDAVTAASEIDRPTTGEEAQFSIPFSVALAFLEGNLSLNHFSNAKLNDPLVKALMNKITVKTDPELDRLLPTKRGAKAEIYLTNGCKYQSTLDIARGEPESPLTQEEIEAKFHRLTKDVLGHKREILIDMINNIEHFRTVKNLTAELKVK